MQFDRAKFKNLVHYVVWKMSGKDGFGATKLYKVLWFAEARAFTLRRQPIAGETYIREEHGPVPHHAKGVRAELVSEGLIAESKINNGKEWLFKSLKPPPTSFLTEQERQDVDYWIATLTRTTRRAQSVNFPITTDGRSPSKEMFCHIMQYGLTAWLSQPQKTSRRLEQKLGRWDFHN